MVLNEDELRQHLAAAADHVSAPRSTPEGLISRIRRRRAKVLGLVLGSLLAVAAIAAAVPAALSGTSKPPAKIPFLLSFTVAVNGQSQVLPENGPPPSFTVTPGEHLRINVDVTVPAHHKVTALWLGITGVVMGPPSELHPILAHTRKPLGPGSHRFRLQWTVPAGLRYPAGTYGTIRRQAYRALPVIFIFASAGSTPAHSSEAARGVCGYQCPNP
jgi:hypothetical protein